MELKCKRCLCMWQASRRHDGVWLLYALPDDGVRWTVTPNLAYQLDRLDWSIPAFLAGCPGCATWFYTNAAGSLPGNALQEQMLAESDVETTVTDRIRDGCHRRRVERLARTFDLLVFDWATDPEAAGVVALRLLVEEDEALHFIVRKGVRQSL